MHKLVLIRHGQSTWNKENRFTGWTDVPLSELGKKQAEMAGSLLKEHGFQFDLAFTSVLERANHTLDLVLAKMNQVGIEIIRDWRLNERHYGSLQGLNKAETAKKYGEEQVKQWRRGYNTPPPLLDKEDDRNPVRDPKYLELSADELPLGESLADTYARVIPYWEAEVVPALRKGRKVLIAAHGNSLRALVKYLDGMSEQAILALNIPTGVPLVYELDENLNSISHHYLGDPSEIEKAISAVASQGSSSSK